MNQKNKKPFHKMGTFLALLAIVFFVQYLGAFWVNASVDSWYQDLNKPSWTPKDEVFGPVWTFLYIVIAAIGYFIWHAKKSEERKKALYVWGAQLVCNALWSYFFFYKKSIALGALDLALLLVLIGFLFHYTNRIAKGATILLLPYTIWVVYAFFINLGIWIQNS